ncbi:MAG TPA: 2-C-methyl-D-erythritol 4-phosphate cytidylyltransferase, partial [candidate division Zixibacteria bacterium]|nr:2-C-methyl-D-erythritol 4-phosphate cytidylyltransferase [candidate division Zixibacteria bacterium]
ESTRKALAKVGKDSELVAIHDGARAAIRVDDIEAVIAAARDSGAAILGRAMSDTVKRIDSGRVVETVDRRRLFRAETPQVFARDLIIRAHEHFEGEPTDDAQAVEALGRAVAVVHAAHANIKLTRPEDVLLMEALIAQKE